MPNEKNGKTLQILGVVAKILRVTIILITIAANTLVTWVTMKNEVVHLQKDIAQLETKVDKGLDKLEQKIDALGKYRLEEK